MCEFETLKDALNAGYSLPTKNDLDISGGKWFGYKYTNECNQKTVTVWFTKERNKVGKLGCFIPMYRPEE